MSERHHEHAERHERVNEQLATEREQKLSALQHAIQPEHDNANERAKQAREAIHGKLETNERHEHHETPVPQEEAEPYEPPTSRPMLSPRVNYAHTMATVRHQLTPVSRSFSKFIHTPVVEKTSEILETTIARPSVVSGATWTALIVGSVFYFTARHYGYMLSGSELLFSFIVGAVVGVLIEGLYFMFRSR